MSQTASFQGLAPCLEGWALLLCCPWLADGTFRCALSVCCTFFWSWWQIPENIYFKGRMTHLAHSFRAFGPQSLCPVSEQCGLASWLWGSMACVIEFTGGPCVTGYSYGERETETSPSLRIGSADRDRGSSPQLCWIWEVVVMEKCLSHKETWPWNGQECVSPGGES